MKLAFITQDDPFYLLPFFEEFLRTYHSEFTITGIHCCRVMGLRSRRQLLKDLVFLYRPMGFLRLCGRRIQYSCLGRIRKHKSAKKFYSLRQLCAAYGIPYRQIGNPNSNEFVKEMNRNRLDLIVSIACPYIIKEPLLSASRLGGINLHHAPLPRYKGMMPTFWQLFHGEREVGITVHYLASKLDEGAALFQSALKVESKDTLDRLISRSKRHGAHCVARVIREIAAGRQQPVVLDQSQGSYFTFPKRSEMREFHRKGLRAI